MTKKIYVDVFVFLLLPIITASSENVPGSRCSAHGRKYYFCQIKRLSAHIRKNTHT